MADQENMQARARKGVSTKSVMQQRSAEQHHARVRHVTGQQRQIHGLLPQMQCRSNRDDRCT